MHRIGGQGAVLISQRELPPAYLWIKKKIEDEHSAGEHHNDGEDDREEAAQDGRCQTAEAVAAAAGGLGDTHGGRAAKDFFAAVAQTCTTLLSKGTGGEVPVWCEYSRYSMPMSPCPAKGYCIRTGFLLTGSTLSPLGHLVPELSNSVIEWSSSSPAN